MRISDHIHAARIPFQVRLDQERVLKRFVYVYLALGEKAHLIDTGVAGCQEDILGLIRDSGRTPAEVESIILTHAHPDHLGGALGLKQTFDCRVAAAEENRIWIEDVEQQYRERPVPGFHRLVQGPVRVDHPLKDDDILELGSESSLRVIYTPGHSKGHIALFHPQDRVLISGDSVPLPGQIPIYEDVPASLRSLEKLGSIREVEVLLNSWDEPRSGLEAENAISRGLEHIRVIHELVIRAREDLGSSNPVEVAPVVFQGLGLPESDFIPLFVITVQAHLMVKGGLD